ncbi:abc transporter g family member 37 [Hordeum vulgare]|nr:abc transporter g family member 37 [Hordeum vulgare]
MLECIALHSPYVDIAADRMSWRLEPSDRFSSRSLYWVKMGMGRPGPGLGPGPVASRGRIPSEVEVLNRNGPGDGICPLRDVMEDSNHIFFTCVTVQFLRSCFCNTIDGHWCRTNVPDLFVKIQFIPSSARHIRWLTIGVLTWTLWTVRNKLVIQRVSLRRDIRVAYPDEALGLSWQNRSESLLNLKLRRLFHQLLTKYQWA